MPRLLTAFAARRALWTFASAAVILAERATVHADDAGASPGPAPMANRGAASAAPSSEGGAAAPLDAGAGSAPIRVDVEDTSARPAPTAHAGGPGSVATMQCAHVAAAPARVRCTVEARVTEGESIGWGDAVLVTTPAFVEALRGRLGPQDAAERNATRWRWELGLVARGNGQGTVGGRVRLVVCMKNACSPRVVPFQGHITVGE
jgi:hypothetical protein